MNRHKKWLVTPAIAIPIAIFAAAPASADRPGHPHAGSCGLGMEIAQADVANPTSPGATEDSQIKPQEIGCNGKG